MAQSLLKTRSSFILRLWMEEDGTWRGWVQHLRTGESAYLNDLASLVAFLEQWAGPLAKSPPDHLDDAGTPNPPPSKQTP